MTAEDFEPAFNKYLNLKGAAQGLDVNLGDKLSMKMDFFISGTISDNTIFRYNPKTGLFERNLERGLLSRLDETEGVAERLLKAGVSADPTMTQEEFFALYAGLLSLIPIQELVSS